MDLRVRCSLNHRKSIPRLTDTASASATHGLEVYSTYIKYRDVTNANGIAMIQKNLRKSIFQASIDKDKRRPSVDAITYESECFCTPSNRSKFIPKYPCRCSAF